MRRRAVADELHFGRAAAKLHMSQPPLSVQVSQLEREVGVQLLERSTRSVTLTPAGRRLRERARQVLDDLESIRADMRDYADGLSGQFSAGFVSSANYTVLPGVVQRFRAHRAGVDLTLVPLTSGEQLTRLREGTLDLGIVRDELPRGGADGCELSAHVVFEERLVACVPVAHPLADQIEITPQQLADVPLIAYPHSLMPGYVERVDSLFEGIAGAPRVIEHVVHQETALSFVAAGVGATVLPESVRQLAPPSIAVVPLTGSPTSRLVAVHPARPRNAAITTAFLECLHTVASSEIDLEPA